MANCLTVGAKINRYKNIAVTQIESPFIAPYEKVYIVRVIYYLVR